MKALLIWLDVIYHDNNDDVTCHDNNDDVIYHDNNDDGINTFMLEVFRLENENYKLNEKKRIIVHMSRSNLKKSFLKKLILWLL